MIADALAPYIHDQPVDEPALFVGRRERVEEMATRVRRGESFAVLAGTRMGKTSLLLQLGHALRASPESPAGRTVVPVLLSTHQFGRLSRTAVFAAILDALRRAVQPSLVDDLKAAIREMRGGHIDQDVAFDYFSSVLVDVMREDDRLQLFVQLDETDEFQSHDWAKVFFSNLRYLISQSEIRRRVNVLIAGTLSSADLWNTAGSPFYNVVTIVDLALLPDQALRQLFPVGFPGGLPADVEAELLREAGGHPYLAQFFLHHLWQHQHRGAALTAGDVREAGERFVRERRGDFQRWWSACGREAQTLFREIVRARDLFKKRTAIEVFADVDAAELALDQLSVNGLVREVQRNRFRVGSRLFARWAVERRPGGGGGTPPPGTGSLDDPLPEDLRDLRPIWDGRRANLDHLPPAFYTRLAARLVEAGDPFLAVDALGEALQRWPDDPAVRCGLGRALVGCASPRRALEVLAPLQDGGHADAETLEAVASAHLAVAARLDGEAAAAARTTAAEHAEQGARHAAADGQQAEAERCRELAARARDGAAAPAEPPGLTPPPGLAPAPVACVPLASAEELSFAEQILDRDGVLFAVLPCHAEVLRSEITGWAGTGADVRLDSVIERAYEIEVVGDHRALDNPLAIPYTRRVAAGLARLRGAATGRAVETPPSAAPETMASDDGAYRVVALLFADAEHFSQLDDAQNRAFGQRYLPAVAELAERSPHAPVVRNTWGDGLYMVFHQLDHAARFAVELLDAVDTPAWDAAGLPQGVRLRVGLHAGPTHALTDPVTGQFTYMGRHVSIAARIEQAAEAHRVAGSGHLVALTATADGAATDGAAGAWEYRGRTALPKDAGTLPLFVLFR